MPITRTIDEGVTVLSLELGRGNAINHAFIDALKAALDETEREGARAVVLTASGRVFCGGLDLVTIYDYDREGMGRFVDAFDGMFERVFSFPRPVIAAINGHALAGGCVLAMAADYRLMQPGPFQIGVNEVAIGIAFPAVAFEITRQATPAAAAANVLLAGARLSPEEAVAAGIVHQLASAQGVVADAVAAAQRFAACGSEAVRHTKADLIAPVLARIEATRAARRERFLDLWFAKDARARIGALRESLVRKPKSAG
jgi:enoyl-CoA hydratase